MSVSKVDPNADGWNVDPPDLTFPATEGILYSVPNADGWSVDPPNMRDKRAFVSIMRKKTETHY